ncbi:succinate dehydrogenase cytochrome b subunit [Paraflavitalea sp. CAU 1676]|uniref:succinate dehydrogenase cytochrome b subunit n=1 Tax=Paraflavitalea sp. CAU 1676 TaxID=3032598 RepID=UPI0023DAB71D|nr:succinate dehydrogenase cytochrome b subunit [Paraflavitalea sp. CAU 1676]MDF2191893.1 succinate dehydrogenase cytochrome b subunit [Paraflavitalea sp. CAU 1676]
MKWSALFTSSIGKKLVMSLTGLFLISFLVVHVGINACIFYDLFNTQDDGQMFNIAAHFMGSNWVPRFLEVGLFAGFLLHIVQGFMVEFQNRSRRGVGYAKQMGNKGSKWYSRSMGLLGTLLLLFLIMHISQFWVPSRITGLPEASYNPEHHDMFIKMVETFTDNPLMVILYLLGVISLYYHLIHGFQSAFRTLGVYNKRYLIMIRSIGIGFSVLVCLLFALMPVSIYFGWIGYSN